MCQANQIVLRARHIAGRLNVLVDILSRPSEMSGTEWSLHPSVFRALTREWGIPLLDLFATRWNQKLPLFVSPVPDPSAMAVDALSMSTVGISIPTTSSVTTGAREGPTWPVWTNPHCPTLAPGDLVPTTLRDVGSLHSWYPTFLSFYPSPEVRSIEIRPISSYTHGEYPGYPLQQTVRLTLPPVSVDPSESLHWRSMSPSGGFSLFGVTYKTLIHSRLLRV